MMKTAIFQLVFAMLLSLFGFSKLNSDEHRKLTDKFFLIVICSYNNEEWFKRNLDSVFNQTYPYFHVIYIDDASTDKTVACVENYIREYHLEDRITLIKNDKNQGAMANRFKGFSMGKPHQIIVDLDADDWLAHRNVLANLNQIYSDEDVWMTYGQFMWYPRYEEGLGLEIPAKVIEENSFRSYYFGTTQLRTFYAGLFKKIKVEDFLYKGEFIRSSSDLAFMFPLLEMAGKHTRFVPQISYIYNIYSPLNDGKIDPLLQQEMDQYIRSKKPYTPISHFSENKKKIYITPGYWGELFDIDNPTYNRDGTLDVLYRLRQEALDEGFCIEQINQLNDLGDFEYLIVFEVIKDQLAQLQHYPKEKLILFLWEPSTVIPDNYNPSYHDYFSKVYTWDDSLVDNIKYFKFHYPVLKPMIEPVDFYSKRLSTLIASNKKSSHPNELYHERDKVINYYEEEHLEDFDLYGKWWPRSYKSYQGPIGRKVDYLKFYRFNYSYENIKNVPGYITEKIFETFEAGVVPIYWGAPNITDYIPENCFIKREDFQSDDALYAFLKNMNEQTYNQYLENIRLFLDSPKAQVFSKEKFIKTMLDLINN